MTEILTSGVLLFVTFCAIVAVFAALYATLETGDTRHEMQNLDRNLRGVERRIATLEGAVNRGSLQ